MSSYQKSLVVSLDIPCICWGNSSSAETLLVSLISYCRFMMWGAISGYSDNFYSMWWSNEKLRFPLTVNMRIVAMIKPASRSSEAMPPESMNFNRTSLIFLNKLDFIYSEIPLQSRFRIGSASSARNSSGETANLRLRSTYWSSLSSSCNSVMISIRPLSISFKILESSVW